MREFEKTSQSYFIPLNPQVCSLRKVKMRVNIGIAQKKATQA